MTQYRSQCRARGVAQYETRGKNPLRCSSCSSGTLDMAPVHWPRGELPRSQTPTDHIFTNPQEKISVTHDVYAQINGITWRDFDIFLNRASIIVQILCHDPPATGS